MKIQTIKMSEDVFDCLYNGKQVTIRNGKRDVELGPVVFLSVVEGRTQNGYIDRIEYCSLSNVRKESMENDGFYDLSDMFNFVMNSSHLSRYDFLLS